MEELPAVAEELFPSLFKPNRKPKHKIRQAALIAATETIVQQAGQKEPTAVMYFGVLLSWIEKHRKSKNANWEMASAAMFLLSELIPNVPGGVIASKFDDISVVFSSILKNYSTDENTVKGAVSVLGSVLASLDARVWMANPTVAKVFDALLEYTGSTNPKVRTAAVHAVRNILKHPQRKAKGMAASAAQAYLVPIISARRGKEDAKETVRALEVAALMAVSLPVDTLSSLAAAVLGMPSLDSAEVKVAAMRVFEAIFNVEDAGVRLSARGLQELVDALPNLQPNRLSVEPTVAYVRMTAAGFAALHAADPALSGPRLPRAFSATFPLLLSDAPQVVAAAAKCLKRLAECVGPEMATMETEGSTDYALGAVVDVVATGLTYQYQAVWGRVILTLATLFKRVRGAAALGLSGALGQLAGLAEVEGFKFLDELYRAIGAAIVALGAEAFLEVVPLRFGEEGVADREWVLALLKKHVSHSTLRYYGTVLLPLARDLKRKSEAAKEEERWILSKRLEMKARQIWELMPAFCSLPTDVPESFGSMADIMGQVLTGEEPLRNTVCQALQNLITRFQKLFQKSVNEVTDEVEAAVADNHHLPISIPHAKASLAAIAKDAPRFLPTLFDLYVNAAEGKGAPILGTIKAYASVADAPLLNKFFKTVMKKLLEITVDAEATPHQKGVRMHAMTDLAASLVHGLEADNLDLLYKVVLPQFSDPDPTLQKKSYRVLAEVCEHHPNWVLGRLEAVMADLYQAREACAANAKGQRLRCFTHAVAMVPAEDLPQLLADPHFLGEIVLTTREVAHKARQNALDLLTLVGKKAEEASASVGPNGPAFSVDILLNQMGVFLAADTPELMAAGVLALAQVVEEHKTAVSAALLDELLKTVLLCFASPSREVVHATAVFCRRIIRAVPHLVLEENLATMIEGLLFSADKLKNRFENQHIFERLIDKFGYERVEERVPQQHKKFITHLRRTLDRRRRKKKAEKEEEGESDSDDEIVVKKEIKKKKKTKKEKQQKGAKAWIMEGGDAPIDFLDDSAVRRVATSDPKSRKLDGDDDDFEKADDGRWIIPDDDEEESSSSTGDDEDGRVVAMDEGEGRGKKKKDKKGAGKKRRREDEDDVGEEEVPQKKRGALSQLLQRKEAARKAKEDAHTGKQFKPKKKTTGGDVKVGPVDPYVYVPLNRDMINKRMRHKNLAKYKKISDTSEAVKVQRKQGSAHKGGRAPSTKGKKGGRSKKGKK